MKKLMMSLAGALFVVIIANAHPAEAQEEGWEVLKQNPATLNPAASYKIARLFQLNLPDPPPIVEVITREDLEKIATVILRGLPHNEDDDANTRLKIQNIWIKSTDIVFVTGEYGRNSLTDLVGDNSVLEDGAVFLYDYLGSGKGNRLTALDGTIRIGSPNGKPVNFSGNSWMNPEGRPTSVGFTLQGSNAEIYNPVFINNMRGLWSHTSNHWREDDSGEFFNDRRYVDATVVNPFFVKNSEALGLWEGRVRILNAFFDRNESVPQYETSVNLKVDLLNTYFGPGQNPTAQWLQEVLSDGPKWTITVATPTVFGETRAVQVWPLAVPFAREDFDRDNTVGTSDIQMIAQVFGDSTNAGLFNWQYDLDEDLVVGNGDFRMIFPAFTHRSVSESAAVLAADSRVREFFTALEPYELADAAVRSDAILGLIYDHLYPTAVAQIASETPTQFSLGANYPNPFNAGTVIQYQIAEDAFVELSVYNMLGHRVATLVSEHQQPGTYRATWDGLGADNTAAATGIYVYRITAGGETRARRMSLLR